MITGTPRRGIAALLYLLFVLPSVYALAAILELDLYMGHGASMYSDYGRNGVEIALAYAFTFSYALWLFLGTIAAMRVFKGQWAVRWLVLWAAIAGIVMLPVAAVFLLGVGHS